MQATTDLFARRLPVRPRSNPGLASVWGLIFAAACGPQGGVQVSHPNPVATVDGAVVHGSNDAGPIIVIPPDSSAPDRRPAADLASADFAAVGCGNGKIDPGLDEACDDGNSRSGD